MFAGYDIIKTLHDTDLVRVVRCTRQSDGLPVIVKAAHDPLVERGRFRYEYRILQALAQAGAPSVQQPVDFLERAGVLAIVTRDIGGASLRALQALQPLDLSEILQVGMRTCAALVAVHRAHVVHKDINPNNIVFNRSSGEVLLIDFGIASQIVQETQPAENLSAIEGTLAYVSPEQTGRMNRLLDYRTDFYSVGVTLYELLTHRRPFEHAKISQQVHAILATTAVPPHAINPEIPPMVSQVVMRLLEKNPDARYQSARGILHDLQICERACSQSQTVPTFTLGTHDVSERFEVAQGLYGREADVERLVQAYERTRHSHAVVLVGGPSGIGKSALVHEVQRFIIERQGMFMAGKHEELRRHVPFLGLGQALAGLVRRLLSGPQDPMDAWSQRLRTAVGPTGQALIDICPSLEHIIGKHQALAPLPAQANENRLLFALRRLFAALYEVQPVVLFLDDLQWADGSTLRFIEHLAVGAPPSGGCGMLFIGAFRDQALDPAHPLARCLQRMERAPTPPVRLQMPPMQERDVAALVRATTPNSRAPVQPLAQWICSKTGGNPFFVREYLKDLHTQGLLTFAPESNGWTWDMQAIAAATLSDNVVSLLQNKLRTRPPEETRLLSLAACLGAQFRLSELAELSGCSRLQTLDLLRTAVISGWVIPLSPQHRYAEETHDDLLYKFVHDRVQQAAYGLLSPEESVRAHYQISQRLLLALDQSLPESRLFEMLEHLNAAQVLLTDPQARMQLAELNWLGGTEAKRAAAYDLAEEYTALALQLLPADAWKTHYTTIRRVQLQLADCEFLTGKTEAAEARLDIVESKCQSGGELAEVYERKAQCQTSLSDYRGAVLFSARALRELGFNFNPEPRGAHVALAMAQLHWQLRGRSIESLPELPEMQDKTVLQVVRILDAMSVPAYFSNPQLYAYLAFTLGRLTVQHGTSEYSAFTLATLCAIQAAMGKPRAAQRYAAAAQSMLMRGSNSYTARRALIATAVSIDYARMTALQLANACHARAIDGMENGDLSLAANSSMADLDAAIFVSVRDAGARLRLYQRLASIGNREIPVWYRMHAQLQRLLAGETASPTTFSDAHFNEDEHLAAFQQGRAGRVGLATHHFLKLLGMCAHAAWDLAIDNGAEGMREGVMVRHGEQVAFYFGSLLAMALTQQALAAGHSRTQDPRFLQRMRRKYASLARAQPGLATGMLHWSQAETAALRGQAEEAALQYEEALPWLRQSGYVGFVALATECYARLRERQGRNDLAQLLWQQALAVHREWGALHRAEVLAKKLSSPPTSDTIR